MEPTREHPSTDDYTDTFPLRSNRGRLIACGLAATLAVVGVFIVARGSVQDDAPGTVHIEAEGATPATSPADAPRRRSGDSEGVDGGFELGERFDGVFDVPKAEAGRDRVEAEYNAGRCHFDMDLPSSWEAEDSGSDVFAVDTSTSGAIGVTCFQHDGRPVEEIAERFPRQFGTSYGALEIVDGQSFDDGAGYRLVFETSDGHHGEVIYCVIGDDLWQFVLAYEAGDDDGADATHEVLSSIRPVTKS
jgi:hypothetical protein